MGGRYLVGISSRQPREQKLTKSKTDRSRVGKQVLQQANLNLESRLELTSWAILSEGSLQEAVTSHVTFSNASALLGTVRNCEVRCLFFITNQLCCSWLQIAIPSISPLFYLQCSGLRDRKFLVVAMCQLTLVLFPQRSPGCLCRAVKLV